MSKAPPQRTLRHRFSSFRFFKSHSGRPRFQPNRGSRFFIRAHASLSCRQCPLFVPHNHANTSLPSTSHELNSNLPANLTDAKLLLSYVKLSGKFGGVSTARHLRSATATVPPSQDCGCGAFAGAARHVEADRHNYEHHRAAGPQHVTAERVQNPASDKRRKRVG